MTILDLSVDSPIFSFSNKAAVRLFFYLFHSSNLLPNGSGIIMRASEYEKHKKELTALQDADFIMVEKNSVHDYIIYYHDNGVIYANNAKQFGEEIELMKKLFTDIKSVRLRESAKSWYRIVEMMELPSKHVTTSGHVMEAWKCAYGLIYQTDLGRTYTGQEIGQFGHLVRMFGTVTSVRLIILYLMEAKVPSIGGLLYNKDLYNLKLNGGNSAVSKTTTGGTFK